ncbi:MAG: hypothetical protein KUG77_06085 [Nannocystaceae bacterium]|nr:hypothetical protein [Nannocystaceae bacterium]
MLAGLCILVGALLGACDGQEPIANDELAEELALLDDEGSALDPEALGGLEQDEGTDRSEQTPTDADRSLQASLDPSLSTVSQEGWAWVTASGSLGGSDVFTGTISSSKLSTGRYLVDITPSPYMNVQVVAYGTSNAACKRVGGAGGTGPQISCFDPDGTLVDSAFVVVFQSATGTHSPFASKGAYVSSPAFGAATYSWNSTGGANTVAWNAGTQTYDVTLPGMNFANASVHATANGAVGDSCRVKNWGAGTVRVKCLDSDGDATQSQFALTYMEDTVLSGHSGGHTWISYGSPSAPYSTAIPYFTCSTPGAFSTASAGLDIDVSLSETYAPASWVEYVPMVSDYGNSENACKIVSWSAPGTGYRARVRCFDGDGDQIDANSIWFTLSFINNEYSAPC